MGSAGRCALGVALLAAGGLLWAAPSASAVTTIGSDLAPSPGNADPCVPDAECTISNSLLPGEQLTSPLDGVVVRWRVRAQATAGIPVDLRLRVLRDAGVGEFTGVNSSATRTIPTTGLATFTYPTRQRIAAGDRIGLDVEPPSDELLIVATAIAGPTFNRWRPPLDDGDTRPIDSAGAGEITLNADVEPDGDRDGFGDETQDDCPGENGPMNGCETTPPETIITKRPQSKVKTRRKKKKVRFKFVSSEAGSIFRCDTDEDLPTACRSPYKSRFPRGKHDFEVVAIDPAGNADPTPATVEFRVKRKRKRR
jgi:hypothetical protein